MEFEPLVYVCLVLCVTVFLEVLFTFRKNSLLKVCFLLIISSLFVMNYLTYVGVESRLQFVAIKSMRVVYVCSTMLAVIYLVSPKIPRWIISIIMLSVFFAISLRIFYFNEINIENMSPAANQVFSVGPEFYSPHIVARNIVFSLVIVAISITFYYYRLFLLKLDREAAYYKYLSRWIISMVVPFFLLTIFGVLVNLNILDESTSSYLFSFFSCTIIFSILLRPRFLNKTSYLEISQRQASVS
jgi:hypothetical protein